MFGSGLESAKKRIVQAKYMKKNPVYVQIRKKERKGHQLEQEQQ